MRKPVGKRLLPPATVGALPLDSTRASHPMRAHGLRGRVGAARHRDRAGDSIRLQRGRWAFGPRGRRESRDRRHRGSRDRRAWRFPGARRSGRSPSGHGLGARVHESPANGHPLRVADRVRRVCLIQPGAVTETEAGQAPRVETASSALGVVVEARQSARAITGTARRPTRPGSTKSSAGSDGSASRRSSAVAAIARGVSSTASTRPSGNATSTRHPSSGWQRLGRT